MKNELLKD